MQGTYQHERIVYPNEDELIEIMKQRPVSSKEMYRFLGITGSPSQKANRLTQFITFLSRQIPVFELEKSLYKILTTEDLDNYWNSRRTTLNDLYDEYNTKG